MSRNQPDRGWRFPVVLDRSGGVAISAGDDNLRDSILMILGTVPGERIKRLDFGCAIHDLVFQPNNATTAGRAAFACEEALRRWEPRIDEIRVTAAPCRAQPNRLEIVVRYVVRASGQPGEVAYPLDLRPGGV